MKKEYDLSKGIRGKFYRADAQLNLPVYLDADVADLVHKFAKRKKVDTQTAVNEMLRKSKSTTKAI